MAIKKFQDLQVEHPQRYEVTNNTGGENLKTIKFSPGKVYQEGTKETAVIFNNIQKNGLYTAIGTRVIEGTEEIYDVELEGLEEFGIFDINLQLVANSKNTTNSPKLRILNEKYSFVNNNGTISVGDLTTNNIHVVKIDTVKKTAFLIGSDKLDKGTYSGKASDLKAEIDLNLIKILGLEYGGELNNNNLKQAGKAYWDNVSKSIYKCLVDNNLYYPENTKYVAISNDDLLLKLNTLFYYNKQTFSYYGLDVTIERMGKICILSILSCTPNTKTGQFSNFPVWCVPLTTGGGSLCGDDPLEATGEMYIYPDNKFEWFVSDISQKALYTGQIIYVAKD